MLKYVGFGFLPGVPARDLTDEEAKEYGRGRLLESGLYLDEKSDKDASHKPTKLDLGGRENK